MQLSGTLQPVHHTDSPNRDESPGLVDYRAADPPQPQLFFDVDDYWPDRVRLGPGLALRQELPPNPFADVSITFQRRGRKAGSFAVRGQEEAARLLYEQEIATVRRGEVFRPWWLA